MNDELFPAVYLADLNGHEFTFLTTVTSNDTGVREVVIILGYGNPSAMIIFRGRLRDDPSGDRFVATQYIASRELGTICNSELRLGPTSEFPHWVELDHNGKKHRWEGPGRVFEDEAFDRSLAKAR